MGQKVVYDNLIQNMKRDTGTYYGIFPTVSDTNSNLGSQKLGIFSYNWAVDWDACTYGNLNVKNTYGMDQGFITCY